MLKFVPINMISPPNYWTYLGSPAATPGNNFAGGFLGVPFSYGPVPDSFWTITGGQATTIWGMITLSDTMGNRPYIPATGASLTALFQRADYGGSLTNQHLSVTKICNLSLSFGAMFSMSLTANEATNITAGTVVFTLTEGTNTQVINQHWAVKKLVIAPGC